MNENSACAYSGLKRGTRPTASRTTRGDTLTTNHPLIPNDHTTQPTKQPYSHTYHSLSVLARPSAVDTSYLFQFSTLR